MATKSTAAAAAPKLKHTPEPITDETPPFRLGIYGEAGVGKTTLALSFPKPLVIDCDAGLEGGAVVDADGEKWTPERWSDVVALYFWLKTQIEKRGYKTIVIDSISSFATLILVEAMESQLGTRAANSADDALIQAEQPDYNKVWTAVNNLLTKLMALHVVYGVHIVMTSAVREPDIDKGRTKRSFDVQPAVEKQLVSWFNTHGEMTAEEVQDPNGEKGEKIERRVLWTKASDPRRKNKTRFAALTPGVVNPTFEKMVGLIEDAREEASTTKKAGK